VITPEQILLELPQTQCTRCGYPDCSGYATAIAMNQAPINLCPPGGKEGIERLSKLTGQPVLALNPNNGTEGPRHVAWIDEAWCIGCTLCIDACPADAIIGTHKLMHTVIESECTGCELCVPVCPVDCIHLENITAGKTAWAAWSLEQAQRARQRYEMRNNRLQNKNQVQSEVSQTTKSTRLEAALTRARHQLENKFSK